MIKKNIKLLTIASAVITSGLLACSKSSDSSSAAAGATNEFSGLAEVTGPVVGASSSSLKFSKVGAFQATTGVLLSSPGTFSSGTSVQLCENVNLIKEILREASSPDKILCYMGKMKANAVIPSSLDVSDGNVKYIKLVNLPGGGGGGNTMPLVKFQIVKVDGAISTFKMWSCFAGSSVSPAQSEYISETFSGGTATVSSKYLGSESGNTFGSSMTATGAFANGSWTSKNISGYRYFSNSGNANVMTINMDQFSDKLNMSLAMNGRYGAGTFINKFYSVVQLLNGNSLSTIALGDGSSKAEMSYDSNSDSTPEFSNSSTISWNGDTKSNLGTASSGDYYSLANAGSVPADPNISQTVTFSGAEAWDCSLPSGESWIDADFNTGGAGIVTGMQDCESKYLSSSNGWITCPY